MKKLLAIIFILAIFSGVFSLILAPSQVCAQVNLEKPGWKGIVPCGRNTGTEAETQPCTLCHFILGFQRLVQYGLYIVTTLALVAIFFAGVMYVISAGDEAMMTSAKAFLKTSLIGFTVILGAWLIVNVVLWAVAAKEDLGIGKASWWQFTCDTTSNVGTGGNGTSFTSGNQTQDPVNSNGNNNVTPEFNSESFYVYPAGGLEVQDEGVYSIKVFFHNSEYSPKDFNYTCQISRSSGLKAESIPDSGCRVIGSGKVGRYNLSLTVTAKDGSVSASKTIPVHVYSGVPEVLF